MASMTTWGFSLLLILEVVAVYFLWFNSRRSSGTFSTSLQYLTAAAIFLAAASGSHLAMKTGLLGGDTASILESYFYILVFLNLLVPAFLWREMERRKMTKLAEGIREFYGEEP